MLNAIPSLPRISDAASASLESSGLLKEATAHEMMTSSLTLWEDGKGAEAGIWQCTAGPSRWSLETQEFVHIVTGHMTVTRDGEEPVAIGPGDTVVFERGWQGTWDITETLRKIYVIF
jgi:uncharacterized cupin superfamily protein